MTVEQAIKRLQKLPLKATLIVVNTEMEDEGILMSINNGATNAELDENSVYLFPFNMRTIYRRRRKKA